MIPLKDDNPTYLRPLATIGLIAACSLVFLCQAVLPEEAEWRLVAGLATIPSVVLQRENLPPDLAVFPWFLDFLAPVTAMFLHANVWHLLFNMLFLWIFGKNVEDAMGPLRFVLFFVVCGVSGDLLFVALEPASRAQSFGASGAVSGVLGAYFLLYPRARVLILAPWAVLFPLALGGLYLFCLPAALAARSWPRFARFSRRMQRTRWHGGNWRPRSLLFIQAPAILVLGAWFLTGVFDAAMGSGGGVAWWAHIGGFQSGMLLIALFRLPHVRLFGAGRLAQTAPPAVARWLERLASRESKLGPDHPRVADGLNRLAMAYHAEDRHAMAARLYRRALEIRRESLGCDHPEVATVLNNLAVTYRAQGRIAEAELCYVEALAIKERTRGASRASLAKTLKNYATLLRTTGQTEKATAIEARITSPR